MTVSDKPAITLQEALSSLTPKDVRVAPKYHEQNAVLARADYAMEQAKKANLQECQQITMTPEEFVKLHALNDTTIWTGQPDKSLCELPEPVAPLNFASGTKADAGKVQLDLIDPDAITGLAAVLTHGAQKYAPHNWRKGIVNSRLIAALLRHLFAIMRGEYTDPDSGLPHIDHVGCCWMFLSHNLKRRPELNDSYTAVNTRNAGVDN